MSTEVGGFWNPQIWFPNNITWDEVAPGLRKGVLYRNYNDIFLPIPMAIFMWALRRLTEKYWFAPLGRSWGLQSQRPKRAEKNPVLEKVYLSKRKLDHKEIQGLAKQVDWTERQVQRWFRLRRSEDKPPLLIKFCENSWRCLYYSSISVFGFYILWDKSWFWDISHLWINYPHHSITDGVWWYYMITLAYYWSLSVTQIFDVKRKDFWEMFIHHVATIALLSLSWFTNHQRVGSLVILLHDLSDIFLEASKVLIYAGFNMPAYIAFGTFTLVWIITRLVIFPVKFLYNGIFEVPKHFAIFPGYFVFNGLFILLFILHVIWSYFIAQFYVRALNEKKAEDVRSSSSEYSGDSD